MEDLSTYPTDIKLYEKMRIIGCGSFGKVIYPILIWIEN